MNKNFNYHIQILYVMKRSPLAFQAELSKWQSKPPCPFKPGTSGAIGHEAWIKAAANVNWLAAWLTCWMRLDVFRWFRAAWTAMMVLFMRAAALLHYYILANITMIPWLWHWRVVHPLSVAWYRRQNNK